MRQMRLDLAHDHGFIEPLAQQRIQRLLRQLTIEAQRHMRRKEESRRCAPESTQLDALVQCAKWAMRIERKHNDLRLHELGRTTETKRDRRSVGGDGPE